MKAATIAFVSLMIAAGVHKHDAQEHADAKTALGKAHCSLEEAVTAALKELPDGKAVQAELLKAPTPSMKWKSSPAAAT